MVFYMHVLLNPYKPVGVKHGITIDEFVKQRDINRLWKEADMYALPVLHVCVLIITVIQIYG